MVNTQLDITEKTIERAREALKVALKCNQAKKGTINGVPGSMIGNPQPSGQAIKAAEEAIFKGELAVCILAGGQGSRLGSSLPKECYDLGLPSEKRLFDLLVERVPSSVPVIVMVSEATEVDTRAYFADHNNFGRQVTFMTQESLPAFTAAEPHELIPTGDNSFFKAPAGNGSFFHAIHTIRNQLEKVKWMHVLPVDNVLGKPADPLMLAMAIENSSEAVSKAVERKNPKESVGVFITDSSSQLQVIEYSELCEHSCSDLPLLANIASHLFSMSLIGRVQELPWHLARKKIPSISAGSKKIVDGLKLESFIFDALPQARNPILQVVKRDHEFAPLKNGPDAQEENPMTCVQALKLNHPELFTS